jgi:hypothetical protein
MHGSAVRNTGDHAWHLALLDGGGGDVVDSLPQFAADSVA